jgi:hypothetical protein
MAFGMAGDFTGTMKNKQCAEPRDEHCGKRTMKMNNRQPQSLGRMN